MRLYLFHKIYTYFTLIIMSEYEIFALVIFKKFFYFYILAMIQYNFRNY